MEKTKYKCPFCESNDVKPPNEVGNVVCNSCGHVWGHFPVKRNKYKCPKCNHIGLDPQNTKRCEKCTQYLYAWCYWV